MITKDGRRCQETIDGFVIVEPAEAVNGNIMAVTYRSSTWDEQYVTFKNMCSQTVKVLHLFAGPFDVEYMDNAGRWSADKAHYVGSGEEVQYRFRRDAFGKPNEIVFFQTILKYEHQGMICATCVGPNFNIDLMHLGMPGY
ncbi:MAG: hypothetical protein VB144_05000 [Clostridia bacterium]|nr:hypothetical protein [Clostridia bacterium]